MSWIGVGVGAPRKGFHVAIVSADGHLELHERRGDDAVT